MGKMGAPGHILLCKNGHVVGRIDEDMDWGDNLDEGLWVDLEELKKKRCLICNERIAFNFYHYGDINDCISFKLRWSPGEKKYLFPDDMTKEQLIELEVYKLSNEKKIKVNRKTIEKLNRKTK